MMLFFTLMFASIVAFFFMWALLGLYVFVKMSKWFFMAFLIFSLCFYVLL